MKDIDYLRKILVAVLAKDDISKVLVTSNNHMIQLRFNTLVSRGFTTMKRKGGTKQIFKTSDRNLDVILIIVLLLSRIFLSYDRRGVEICFGLYLLCDFCRWFSGFTSISRLNLILQQLLLLLINVFVSWLKQSTNYILLAKCIL